MGKASVSIDGGQVATINGYAQAPEFGIEDRFTQLGAGAFGNRDDWIHNAARRSLKLVSHANLDVRLVSYGHPSQTLLDLARNFE